MKITTKFNLVLFSVLTISILVTGFFSYKVLRNNAREEVIQHAGMMLESALAIRSYTVTEVRPLLREKMVHKFLPQSVPAYAASQSFKIIRKNRPEYSYKEATINPTNLKNRAVDWETDIIRAFQQTNKKEITGIRMTPTGKSLFLARPIVIKKEGCLTCHSTPSIAPATLITKYGSNNGFGWALNQIVGAQIISVPMSVPIEKANHAFTTFMGSVLGVYLFIIIVLNIMLRSLFIKPVMRMADMANQISTGKMMNSEFEERGKDEIAILGTSFNRMRRSLVKAIALIEKSHNTTP